MLMPFLGVKYDEKQIEELIENLKIENMRKNRGIEPTELLIKMGLFKKDEGSFVRSGKQGGFKPYLDDEMLKEMEEWKKENCKKYNIPEDIFETQ